MKKIIEILKRLVKYPYFLLLEAEVLLKGFWWKLRGGKVPASHSIPIIINNYNRLSMLKQLLSSLEQRGYNNIIILDNCSTFPPLLEFYKETCYRVVFLDENYGFLALWKAPGLFKQFKNQFYVYTDPDVVLDEGCPDDFMSYFLDVMKRYPACQKVGFGIRIDDLPDCYKEKNYVLWWERRHWEHPYGENLYKARTDTTFALYRPYCKGGHSSHLVLRTGFPYVIRHLPWYLDTDNLSEEEQYYIEHVKKPSMWSGLLK